MKIISLFFAFNILINTSFAFQVINDSDSIKLYLKFESLHLDFTSAIFINDLSLSSDFEIYKTDFQAFGIQAGYSHLIAGETGGPEYGSPFHDINLLAYTSIGHDKILTTQLLIGYTNRMSSKSYAKGYPVGGLKAGIGFMLNLNKLKVIFQV